MFLLGFRCGTWWCNILVFSNRAPSSQASFPPFTSSRGVSPFEEFRGIFIETNNQQQTSLAKPTTNIIIETNNGHLYRNHNNSLRTKTQNPDGIDSKALFQQFQGVSRVLSDETLLSKNFLRNKLNHTNSNALTNKTVFPFDTNINRVTQQTLSGRVNKLWGRFDKTYNLSFFRSHSLLAFAGATMNWSVRS